MSLRRLILLALGAAVILIAAWSGYWVMRPDSASTRAGVVDITRLDVGLLNDTPDTSISIAIFEARIEANSQSYLDYTLLGDLYLERARQTGNVEDLGRAQAAFATALEIVPAYGPATAGYGAALYNAHDFAGAVEWSARVPPGTDGYLRAQGTIGDAYLSTGDYTRAAEVYALLDRQAPGASTRARMAQLAYIMGRPDEALRLAKAAAVDAYLSGASPEAMAWHVYRVADLLFSSGGIDDAAAHYRSALSLDSRHYPSLAGLARVHAAQGRLDDAIQLYVQAVAIVPQPSLISALGDLYTLAGREPEAETQYATVNVIALLSALGQAVYNRELALYYADHNINTDDAVALTTAEIAVRRDIHGYDALAWSLYRAGRFDEASEAVSRALETGVLDASVHYHAGMISSALGRDNEARASLELALRINPHFSILQSANARASLTALPAAPPSSLLAGVVSP